MNGTVAPPSRRSTAATTCAGRTPNSVAIWMLIAMATAAAVGAGVSVTLAFCRVHPATARRAPPGRRDRRRSWTVGWFLRAVPMTTVSDVGDTEGADALGDWCAM